MYIEQMNALVTYHEYVGLRCFHTSPSTQEPYLVMSLDFCGNGNTNSKWDWMSYCSSMAIKAIVCASGSRHLHAVEQFFCMQEYTVTLSLWSSTAW